MGEFENLTHSQLYRLRNSLPDNHPLHAILGPLEHRAFAREWAKENPYLAVPSILFAAPFYSAAKGAGILQGRSPASFNEISSAYQGAYQGMLRQ